MTDAASPLRSGFRPARRRLKARIEAMWRLAPPAPPPAGDAPRFSLVTPVHDADPRWLDDLLASFLAQPAGVAELLLQDDGSTRPETLAWLAAPRRAPGLRTLPARPNGGIAAASNAALAAARGAWVGFVDQDDLLAPGAVAALAAALDARPEALFLYTDEITVDDRLHPVSAFLKPGFDPVLLSGMNYVNHLSLYRRDRLSALGGLAEGFEGSQDYELLIRYCRGLAPEQILHLPYPAYIWRQRSASFSHSRLEEATGAARRALARGYSREGTAARAEPAPRLGHLHRLRFDHAGARPTLSVVIPNRDSPKLIAMTLDGLFNRTDAADFETIVVDNGSTDPETLALYDRLRRERPGFRAEIEPAPFNFSAMANRGAARARGDHVLLLNNDVEIVEPGWLSEMMECMAYPGVGVVGARLLFPNRTIQHAGVILGLGGLAGHWFYKARETTTGPMGRLALRNGLTVVTGACMLISRACLDAVGPFDEERFRVAYNDVDFCARARAAGFGVVWTPYATLLHHESASRGSDKLRRNAARFREEQAALRARWDTERFQDPGFSPWWSRYRSRPRIVVGDALPPPRSFMGMDGY